MSVVFAVLFIAILYLRTFVFSKEISGNIRYDSVLYVSSIIKNRKNEKETGDYNVGVCA